MIVFLYNIAVVNIFQRVLIALIEEADISVMIGVKINSSVTVGIVLIPDRLRVVIAACVVNFSDLSVCEERKSGHTYSGLVASDCFIAVFIGFGFIIGSIL